MSIREAEYRDVSQRAKLASDKLMQERIGVDMDFHDEAGFDGKA